MRVLVVDEDAVSVVRRLDPLGEELLVELVLVIQNHQLVESCGFG